MEIVASVKGFLLALSFYILLLHIQFFLICSSITYIGRENDDQSNAVSYQLLSASSLKILAEFINSFTTFNGVNLLRKYNINLSSTFMHVNFIFYFALFSYHVSYTNCTRPDSWNHAHTHAHTPQ